MQHYKYLMVANFVEKQSFEKELRKAKDIVTYVYV